MTAQDCSPSIPTLLTPTRLNDFLACSHRTSLWLAGVASDQPEPLSELLRAKGLLHETKVLTGLEAVHGAATRIPQEGSLSSRKRATLDAIRSGARLIYQGVLSDGLWRGIPDFLIRKEADADAATFEPHDAKLGTKSRSEHVLQLGVYAELLRNLGGGTVSGGTVHIARGQPERFDLRQTRYILKRLMRRFERFVASPQLTRPIKCAACAGCGYKTKCEADWRSGDSLYLVAGITIHQADKLEQRGISTVVQLASLDGTPKAGISPETLCNLVTQARLQLNARDSDEAAVELLAPEPHRGFHLLPAHNANDLYLDMEGDPFIAEGREFLFGVWRPSEPASGRYSAFWAHDTAQEKSAFQALMDLMVDHLRRNRDAHVFHFGHYEPTALKRLAMRYSTKERDLDDLLREHRFVDLLTIVRQGLRASTEAYGLKDLRSLYWPDCVEELLTGADCIVQYERWCLTQDPAILQAIAQYNERDCQSVERMQSWLESLRPAGADYDIPQKKVAAEEERAKKRLALEDQKQALASRIRIAKIGNQRLRDTVAELLWFHQRARKPEWWRIFDRQTWSNEELVNDAESLGALSRDKSVPPRRVKRSIETAFAFPPQDTKLKIGETASLADTLAYAGKIVALAPEEGRIVLLRGERNSELPDHFNLVVEPFRQRPLAAAIMRFGEAYASDDVESYQALLDFLLRRPPRFKTRKNGEPIRAETEEVVGGAIRAAKDLDGSYLFIQGPPGTGKTYTIANVILSLLADGVRVGVSSNSHKAINKVLEEVEKLAGVTGQRFAGVKKGTEDARDTFFDSENIETVYRSEDVAPYHRLVGGTAFHFCREDQQGAYDYLFVDEAGQVSLGNLVAMAGSAHNIVLTGDQMQLPQPVEGVHPAETGLSCLEYLLQGQQTVPDTLGIFLDSTFRLPADLCRIISAGVYNGRLRNRPESLARHLVLKPNAPQVFHPTGLVFYSVDHEDCTQSSPPEADAIAKLVDELLQQQVCRKTGLVNDLTLEDVLTVAPYNMQVCTLRRRLPRHAKIGTVDKFQGQEAPVVLVSMTTSRGEDAPHGTEFLFSRNRFNVAISRAQCLAIVVHGSCLFESTGAVLRIWSGLIYSHMRKRKLGA